MAELMFLSCKLPYPLPCCNVVTDNIAKDPLTTEVLINIVSGGEGDFLKDIVPRMLYLGCFSE
jgi:hypothetical protein